MLFSYNWIRELVPGLDQPAAALERLITLKTAECEGIERVGALLETACAARVQSVEPIPNSHNVKAVIDAGRYGIRTVVCGAPNCRPGVVTAYAPIGKKVIAGIESDGMLASAAELGISKDHSGIIELDSQVGAPLAGCLPDHVIEIDNKSITHRPDLWGHFGMAREVAAITGRRLADPVRLDLVPAGDPAIRVVVEDEDLCPRYSALVFEDVAVRPSPEWLQCRLTAIGLNPISNMVDMTNFVMAELAQPMHAFDLDKLHGDTIFVRRARRGERFRALNGEEYTLDESNLVIADAAGAIGLAGVMGGMESAISETTRRVVLESACFHPGSIRKTSAALKLRTDASMRFEKAQDPANTVRGIARAIALLRDIAPGIRTVGGVADRKKDIDAPPPIPLPLDWLDRKLGRAVPAAEVREILERLEFGVEEPAPRAFSVTVPSWRATKDISIPDDLVEEVGRMVGYDSITPTAPLVPAAVPPGNPERRFQHEVRDVLVDLGFTEVYNYSFLSEEAARAFGFDPAGHVRVLNPIASDQVLLRDSLLPGIWKNILENARHREQFRIFEIGLEIHKRYEGLPEEVPHAVAAIYDRSGNGVAGLFELKHAALCLLPELAVEPDAAAPYEHPARSANLVAQGRRVGRLFELHPKLVETGHAAILDIDLRVLEGFGARPVQYKPVRRYPASAFDLSVIAGEREYAAKLESAIASFGGPLVESVSFVRQYSGPPLESGRKSVSFRLTVGSSERTLSSEEVAEVRARVIEGMRGLGYELRV
jgi:phenylalanyl-tRNA synthetase beta chain